MKWAPLGKTAGSIEAYRLGCANEPCVHICLKKLAMTPTEAKEVIHALQKAIEYAERKEEKIHKYVVRYKHSEGNGIGFFKSLKSARNDAKILNGKVFHLSKDGKVGDEVK